MSYQVLARKWRPKSFHTLVGQEHVLKALVNALDSGRLHHAYLFTGTRGVGKTTISRILAKCLNCETGVSSRPCGECAACTAIDEGRFVDLIEVDAASRTKVEDTRELLDNVQYRPTAGRYKVYLIDEVHMLSNHSFNALLKTLEEPPPHVKFLLATTDPQKLPITILSRCLKFHLKNLTPERIEGYLADVMGQEGIAAERPALRLLAKSAGGSMRDALSLLDQAIAHGQGRVEDADVREMLGVIDRGHVYRLLDALAAGDGEGLLAAVAHCAEFSPDYEDVLGELLSLLHRVAVAQTVPGFEPGLFDDGERVAEYAARLSPEDIQLYYQIGLHGRRDLSLAPDAREGLTMSLLRMLAFRPEEGGEPAPRRERPAGERVSAAPVAPAQAKSPEPAPTARKVEALAPQAEPAAAAPRAEAPAPMAAAVDFFAESPARPAMSAGPARSVPTSGVANLRAALHGNAAAQTNARTLAPEPVRQAEPSVPPEPVRANTAPKLSLVDKPMPSPTIAPVDEALAAAARAGEWWAIVESLGIAGPSEQLAQNTLLRERQGAELLLDLGIAGRAFNTPARIATLEAALSVHYGEAMRVKISEQEPSAETPAQRRRRIEAERLAAATESLMRDEVVHALRAAFGAEIVPDSIKPI